ncbi:MAG: long-chain fatty acid--CoA ligase, partial [Clostridia bacterium]|nr:long-chain fatty acid--CoA ligase [Clostridia bacterium]
MKNIHKARKIKDFRDLIDFSAKKYSSRNAFKLRSDSGKYRKIKYRELKDRYYSLCSYFLSQGLKGESIAVVGDNSYEWTLCYLAAASVGVAVPLDKELSAEDIENFLRHAECKAVCADEKIISRLAFKAEDGYELYSFEDVDKAYSTLPCDRLEEVKSIEIPNDKTSVLIFTSGTTGSAKGVCLSQRNLLSNIHSTLS